LIILTSINQETFTRVGVMQKKGLVAGVYDGQGSDSYAQE